MCQRKKERKKERRIIIIINGAKTISLQTLFGRLNNMQDKGIVVTMRTIPPIAKKGGVY